MSSPNKHQLFAKIRIFFEIFNVKSDWTKPLRGNVSLDLMYNAKVLDLSIAPDNFNLMILLR